MYIKFIFPKPSKKVVRIVITFLIVYNNTMISSNESPVFKTAKPPVNNKGLNLKHIHSIERSDLSVHRPTETIFKWHVCRSSEKATDGENTFLIRVDLRLCVLETGVLLQHNRMVLNVFPIT